MILFLDESGGINAGHEKLFLVVGVVLRARQAQRTIAHFRKRKDWQLEVKGGKMDTALQLYFLRDALGDVEWAGAIAVDVQMARTLPIKAHFGEHALYASMVSELLCEPQLAAIPLTQIVADGGRYKARIMRQLAADIAACHQIHRPGGTHPRVEFSDSESSPGIQIADVLANHLFRQLNVSAPAAVAVTPDTPPAPSGAIVAPRVIHHVAVQSGALTGLAIPAWMAALPGPMPGARMVSV